MNLPNIRQRGKSFCYTVEIQRKRTTDERKRITRGGFTSKHEAEQDAIKTLSKVMDGKLLGIPEENFDKLLKQFVEDKNLEVRYATLRNIKNVVNNHISPYFGKIRVDEITERKIRDFFIYLDNKGLEATTIKQIRVTLIDCLNSAVKQDIITKNPAREVKPPNTRRKAQKRFDYWNKEEFILFLNWAKSSEWYLGYLIALFTGAREGEILALQWRNVNFNSNTITFDQALSKAEVGYEISNTKNVSSDRTVGLPKEVMQEIMQYRDLINTRGKKVYNDRNDFVVHTSKGTTVHPTNFYKEFIRITMEAGLRRIRVHDLRHSHATHLLDNGMNINGVAARLGHSKSTTTLEVYAHITKRMELGINNIIMDDMLSLNSAP